MEHSELVAKFSSTAENQRKAIFSTLFILGNKLQTLFDNHIPQISLKQFMLLSIVRQSKTPLTFTQLGNLLGCSRQNIKKLAEVLSKKGFLAMEQNACDPRAMCLVPTKKGNDFFETDFLPYQKELEYLFSVYTDAELEVFFQLFTRLYEGVHRLEQKLENTGEKEDFYEQNTDSL